MPEYETKITELLRVFHSLNREDQEWTVKILSRILEIKDKEKTNELS